MIRKYHNHKLQTNPRHREEEPNNNHETPGRQTKQSNQLSLSQLKCITDTLLTLNFCKSQIILTIFFINALNAAQEMCKKTTTNTRRRTKL